MTERNELRLARDAFRNTVEASPDAILVLDEERRIRYANPATETFFGRDRSDLVGSAFGEPLVSETNGAARVEVFRPAEVQVVTRGGVRHGHMRVVRTNWEGEPALLVTLRDVTEEARLREGMEHLNRVLRAIRNVNQLIVREKQPGRLIREACEILVETRSYNGAWIILDHQDAAQRESACIGFPDAAFAALAGLDDRARRCPCFRGNGRGQDITVRKDPAVECRGCPLADAYGGAAASSVCLEHEGRVYGRLGVSAPAEFVEDEEEQSLLAEAAGDIAFALHAIETNAGKARSETTLRAMFDGAVDGILLADAETRRFVTANAAICRMLGYSRDELLELSVDDIHPPDDLPHVAAEFEKQLRGETALT